jgi:hypothetical protein
VLRAHTSALRSVGRVYYVRVKILPSTSGGGGKQKQVEYLAHRIGVGKEIRSINMGKEISIKKYESEISLGPPPPRVT